MHGAEYDRCEFVEETSMPNDPRFSDARELPPARDGLTRFLGGSPLAVAFRLILHGLSTEVLHGLLVQRKLAGS